MGKKIIYTGVTIGTCIPLLSYKAALRLEKKRETKKKRERWEGWGHETMDYSELCTRPLRKFVGGKCM